MYNRFLGAVNCAAIFAAIAIQWHIVDRILESNPVDASKRRKVLQLLALLQNSYSRRDAYHFCAFLRERGISDWYIHEMCWDVIGAFMDRVRRGRGRRSPNAKKMKVDRHHLWSRLASDSSTKGTVAPTVLQASVLGCTSIASESSTSRKR